MAMTSTDYMGQPLLFLKTTTFMSIGILVIIEWMQRNKEFALQIDNFRTPTRHVAYILVLLMIFTFGDFGDNQFIYFQF